MINAILVIVLTYYELAAATYYSYYFEQPRAGNGLSRSPLVYTAYTLYHIYTIRLTPYPYQPFLTTKHYNIEIQLFNQLGNIFPYRSSFTGSVLEKILPVELGVYFPVHSQ